MVQPSFPAAVLPLKEAAKDYSIAGKFRAPINLHIGNIGNTPKTGAGRAMLGMG